eukprot:scaffold116951_cov42-Cyclotella_meneghiniana.AAC.4
MVPHPVMDATALPMPPRPLMHTGHYGMDNSKPLDQLKVNEEVTISTVTGSIGKTELSQVVNSIMAQVKASMETSMGMIHPESRFVKCLNERDSRLKADLDERDKHLKNYMASLLQNLQTQTQKTTEVQTDEKGISTEIKVKTKQTMATLDEAHKAINFDQYLETKEPDGKVGDALTPNTKALKAQCAATPLKESWEDALENEDTTDIQPSEEDDPNSNNIASGTNESATNEISSEIVAPIDEEVTIDETIDPQEVNYRALEAQSTETSNQQNDNDDDNVQENPSPIPNASHNYSEGFHGGDASSTASDVQLGLDTASITQNTKTKASKRRSERLGLKAPPSTKETTESDVT